MLDFKISKSKIDKAGDLLKSEHHSQLELSQALDILSYWRDLHARPLDSFAKILKTRAKNINKSAIVAQRLKRTPSILLKLANHQTMRLSTMQDIGGLRAICDTTTEVYKILDLYKYSKSKHSLYSMNDYIEEPKKDGYRSLHLIYKLSKAPNLFIEIQLRSHLQHIWATGVEVFGTLKNSSFKSGHGNKEWLEFFSLLSSVFAIKEGTPKLHQHNVLSQAELIKLLKRKMTDLQVIDNLNVYTMIYRTFSKNTSKGRKGHYSLILLNSRENTISIQSFSAHQYDQAAKAYLDLERLHYKDKQMNIVLVNISDLKKLEESYPNYFMDTKVLVKNLSLIMLDRFI